MKPPYNLNSAAEVAARESLKDLDYLKGTVKAIVAERERLFQKLKRTGILRPLPSRANFILCPVVDGQALEIKEQLEKRGIFVRYFDSPLLKNMIRISVGKPEHTDTLMEALREIGGKHG
jgi:histidinol-phosphate aminotransferase